MVAEHQLSERRACRLVGLSRDSYRHPPEPDQLTIELASKIVEIAQRHRFDEIIVGGKIAYYGGAIAVPTGPSPGVNLDPERMDKYERYYEKMGDYYARFHVDPQRPDW
jgi:hypothetical protein